MARGKYLSLEEARKKKRLDRFYKEHLSEGDEKAFDELLDAMASGKQENVKHQLRMLPTGEWERDIGPPSLSRSTSPAP